MDTPDTLNAGAVLGAALFNLVFLTGLALAFWLADRHARQPLWLVSLLYLWGIVAVPILAPLLFPDAGGLGEMLRPAIDRVLWIPLAEEAMKGAPLLLLVLLPTIYADRPADLLVAGALVGLGVAMTENLQRIEGDIASWTAVLVQSKLRSRLFMAPAGHGGTTALLGLALGAARCAPRPFARAYLSPLVLLLVVAWHGLFNAFNLTAWSSGTPEWLFAISLTQVKIIQYAMALGTGVVVVIALRRLLRSEQRTLERFAARSVEEGLLPADLAGKLPSWRGRAGNPRARRLLRLASRLGVMTDQLEAAGGRKRGLQRRVDRLRAKVTRLLARPE